MLKHKKGQAFDQLAGLFGAIASITIILIVVFLVLAQGQDQIVSIQGITDEANTTQMTTAYNASGTLTNAVADIPDWMPIIIITIIGAALIGLVAVFRRRN